MVKADGKAASRTTIEDTYVTLARKDDAEINIESFVRRHN